MSKTSKQTFALFLALAAIVAAAPLMWSRGKGGDDARAGLAVGSAAPPIEGAGWVNGEPDAEAIKGKVTVVNAWSLNCPYCEKGLPELVDVFEQYKDKDVVFLGLSLDKSDRVEDIKKYLMKHKALWPNTYDARKTALAYKAEYIPGYWVIDSKGVVVWNKSSKESITDAIDRALKEAA